MGLNARRGRRGLRFLLGFLILLLILANYAGRALVLDAPERSDVILVLAGETDRRPARALELLDQGFGRQVVLDVPSTAKVYELSEVGLATRYAQDIGRGAAVRVCPIEGLSTRDESHDAEKCLAGEKSERVLIVTSDFHTRRAINIFRHEIKGKSFSVAAAHNDGQFGTRWWTHREWAKTCLEEWMKVLWWNAVDRWR